MPFYLDQINELKQSQANQEQINAKQEQINKENKIALKEIIERRNNDDLETYKMER